MSVRDTVLPIVLFLGVAALSGFLYIQSSTPLENLTSGIECSDLGLTYSIDPSRAMMKYTAQASLYREGDARNLTVDYTIVVLNDICEGQAVVYGQIDDATGDLAILGVLARFTLTNFQLPQTVPATSYYYILPLEAIESVEFNDTIVDIGGMVRPSYGFTGTTEQSVGNGLKQYTSVKWRFDKETGILLELRLSDVIVDTNGIERQRIDISIEHRSLYLLDNETQLYINPKPLTWSSSISLAIFGVSTVLALLAGFNRVLA